MRFLSNFLKKMSGKYFMRRSWMAIVLVGMLAPLFPVNAQTQQLANPGMVGQLIVKLKPSADQETNDVQSQALSASPSKKPLEKLQLVIDRVQKARKDKRSRLLRNQKHAAPDVASRMHAEKAIDNNMVVISLDGAISRSEAEQLMKDIAADEAVEYVEPDVHVSHFLEPHDTYYAKQWGYSAPIGGANLPAAWDQTEGSADIVVAVIDTGYLPHADLKDNLQLPGYDFISKPYIANRNDPPILDGRDYGDWITAEEAANSDRANPFYLCGSGITRKEFRKSSWHGSHVAGTIGAVSNNRLGVSGISWKGKILPVRVLGKCGGFTSDVLIGMRWAAGLPVAIDNVPANTHPARVLNLSLGSAEPCTLSFTETIKEIKNNGVSIVVAAGNSTKPVSEFMPANCPGVIAVSATDANGKLAGFSNYGSKVGEITISAPGVNILSTVNAGETRPGAEPESDDYRSYNGTSMAAPHVAGVIALMLAVNPQLTPDQISQKLHDSARKFPDGSNCTTTKCGPGLLDAGEAIKPVKHMNN